MEKEKDLVEAVEYLVLYKNGKYKIVYACWLSGLLLQIDHRDKKIKGIYCRVKLEAHKSGRPRKTAIKD